jgi:hypothetical protein
MTVEQWMRMQRLMLKDEVQKLTQAEHDELLVLCELAEMAHETTILSQIKTNI